MFDVVQYGSMMFLLSGYLRFPKIAIKLKV